MITRRKLETVIKYNSVHTKFALTNYPPITPNTSLVSFSESPLFPRFILNIMAAAFQHKETILLSKGRKEQLLTPKPSCHYLHSS